MLLKSFSFNKFLKTNKYGKGKLKKKTYSFFVLFTMYIIYNIYIFICIYKTYVRHKGKTSINVIFFFAKIRKKKFQKSTDLKKNLRIIKNKTHRAKVTQKMYIRDSKKPFHN